MKNTLHRWLLVQKDKLHLFIYKIYKLCSILHKKQDRQFRKMVDSRELSFSRASVLFKGRVSSASQDLNSRGLVDLSSSTRWGNLFLNSKLILIVFVLCSTWNTIFGGLWRKLSKHKNVHRISLILHDLIFKYFSMLYLSIFLHRSWKFSLGMYITNGF